jgi:tRNA1Val (adenine37-N6)-methyltransferase
MSIFRFKQFEVNQSGCAMKVNTDGVLLGAMAELQEPGRILDIGTGTGVIALILAQRFPGANITAVEIDKVASATAANNFATSVFNARLEIISSSFQTYFEEVTQDRFDLIISNPPFFIDSLRPDDPLKTIARHTDQAFFENMLCKSALNLNQRGELWLIVPIKISELIRKIAIEFGLHVQRQVSIRSFPDSIPHREILSLGFTSGSAKISEFVIYSQAKEYSAAYRNLLKEFLTIF